MPLWRKLLTREKLLGWGFVGWTLALLIGAGLSMIVVFTGFNLARGAEVCFSVAALIMLTKVVEIAVTAGPPHSPWERLIFTFCLFGVIGVGIVEVVRWIERHRPIPSTEAQGMTTLPSPVASATGTAVVPPLAEPPKIGGAGIDNRSASIDSHPPQEPVVHVEPEREMIWSTKSEQKVGEYHLILSNTGMEDIDHIGVIEDYFVALKLKQGGIIIKNVGGVPVDSGASMSLKSKHQCQVFVSFTANIDVMNEVARNNGVPSLRGVRLTITFRRTADGREYRVVKGYGVMGPKAEGVFPPGVPQDAFMAELRNQFLSMSEVVPFLELRDYWTAVVHEIGQDSQGQLTHRYY